MERKKLVTFLGSVCLILVLAALPFMAACGPEEVTPTLPEEEKPTPPEEEAVLRIAVPELDEYFDPINFNNVNCPQMQVAIYEGLARYKLGTFQLEPLLATQWEVSNDGLVWRFFLHRGVQFHHGYGELKAEDVVFTFERAKDPRCEGSPFSHEFDEIKSMEAEDDYTVRITLSSPDPVFLHRMVGCHGYIVSKKAVTEIGWEEFNLNPVGTGPYALSHVIVGQETVLVKHDKYWGREPQLDRVEYLTIPDPTTMYNAFEAGDVDMFGVLDPQKLLGYKEDPNVQTQSIQGLHLRLLGMNPNYKPFDDIRVRKAIAYAINPDEIIVGLWGGTTTRAKGFFTPCVAHAFTDFADVWQPRYDPVKAKELLTEAGYPDGFETTIYCPASDRIVKPMVVIQEQLKAIGIDAKLQRMEIAPFYGGLIKGEWPFFGMIDNFEPYLDRHIEGQFLSTRYPGDNWTGFQDPEVDEWLRQALSSTDEEVRDELFKKVQKRVIESVHFYFIDWETFHYVLHNKVKGFVLDAQRALYLDNIHIED